MVFDALLRRDNVDRYDDRIMLYTNLIETFDLLMGFVEKHLNDPFYLEGNERVSLRDRIFRELVSNLIAHREYNYQQPAVAQGLIEMTIPGKPQSRLQKYRLTDKGHRILEQDREGA